MKVRDSGPGAVLVLGSSGLLGSTLVPTLREMGHKVVAASRSSEAADVQVNPLSFNSTKTVLLKVKPDFVINLVSHTSVEECELDPALAKSVNAVPNLNLVAVRRTTPALRFKVINVSTDHFYDAPGESLEADVSLLNEYAISKFQGELALELDVDLTLRTNFVGRSRNPIRQSLTDWVETSAKSPNLVSVLEDVYFSPLAMSTLSSVMSQILVRFHPGVFNLGSRQGSSKADFDISFASSLGLKHDHFRRISLAEAHFLSARRPRDMRMDVTKFEESFDLELPTLEDEILKMAKEYKSELSR
jgi:dTDP-4-dehydrorhamnose reductase